jgi:hypothetical protein
MNVIKSIRVVNTTCFLQFKIISPLFRFLFRTFSWLKAYSCHMSQMKRQIQKKLKPISPTCALIGGCILALPLSGLNALSFPTLTDAPGARSVALGEAFSAVSDDITAYHYNPASLSSLQNPQASIFYEKGIVNDTYGQLMTGFRHNNHGYGAFVSYYDEGTLEFYDVDSIQQLHGRQEMTVGLGASRSISNFSVGINGKHISSQLIEGARDSSWALDIGAQSKFLGQNKIGLALRNIGPHIKFFGASTPLPRNAQLGVASPFSLTHLNGLVLANANYDLNDQNIVPSFGLEIPAGPLALRAGFKSHQGQTEYSFGTGFSLSWFSMDYAVVVAPLLDSQHKFSLNMKWGSTNSELFSAPPKKNTSAETHAKFDNANNNDPEILKIKESSTHDFKYTNNRKVYEVKEGETWESISIKFYGSSNPVFIRNIKNSNRHYLKNNDHQRSEVDPELKAGQVILINQTK